MLTPRQREILELIGAGLTNDEIAGRLGCAVNTVKVHKRAMYERACPNGEPGYAAWLFRMVAEVCYGLDGAALEKARAEGYAAGSLDGEHRGYERGRAEEAARLVRALESLGARLPRQGTDGRTAVGVVH